MEGETLATSKHAERGLDRGRKMLLATGMIAASTPFAFGQGSAGRQAQMTPVKIPSAQSIMMPEWQKAAGGKMAFEVISLRRSEPGAFTPANMNITTADSFHPIGGLFSADFPLATYIEFAYKLLLTP